MSSNTKLAAERLLKIADAIEEEAYNNTYFVCDSCNHTASLKTINDKRKEAAKNSNVLHVANVTVNDDIVCLACGGKMSYVPTENSMKFYVEAENDEEEDTGEELDIFEPVDEQNKKNKEEELPGDGLLPEETSLEESPEGTPKEEEGAPPVEEESEMSENITEEKGAPSVEEESEKDITEEDGAPLVEEESEEDIPGENEEETDSVPSTDETGIPSEEKEEDVDIPEGDSDIAPTEDTGEPVIEETVEEDVLEEKPKKKKKNKDIDFPQEETPKFEKIPKDASDAFWASVKKYSI